MAEALQRSFEEDGSMMKKLKFIHDVIMRKEEPYKQQIVP